MKILIAKEKCCLASALMDTQPERTDQTVMFWNTKTDGTDGGCVLKYFKKLLGIKACAENCGLVANTYAALHSVQIHMFVYCRHSQHYYCVESVSPSWT